MDLYVLLAAPVAAALVTVAARGRIGSLWASVVADGLVLSGGVALAARSVHGRPVQAAGGLLRLDALSAFMVVVIGAIAVLATWYGVRYVGAESAEGRCTSRQVVLYGVLVQIFVVTMLVAVLAANIGVLWVAVEATTIATTFLVGHRRTRGSLEASWKYVVICSVGIALAFLGTVLVYLAAVHGGGHSLHALDWTRLQAHAHGLDPKVMRLAFGLLVVGYGAKVGLAPMHSWLPDAHSQAPAPVSALMSGVLLTVAFYALLRFKAIADVALGPAYPRELFVGVALLSLGIASGLLVTQRDYKRMLAYHSIEHMGLIALGAAAGSTLAIIGVLLHILGHGLAKGVLFLASGEILLEEKTSDMRKVTALVSRRPALGGIFGFGLVALLGLPPFSLFTSELTMLRGELQSGLAWAAAVSLVAMAVIFAAVATHARHMLLGGDSATAPTRTSAGIAAPLVCGLAVCAAIGVSAWPLSTLLQAAAHVVVR